MRRLGGQFARGRVAVAIAVAVRPGARRGARRRRAGLTAGAGAAHPRAGRAGAGVDGLAPVDGPAGRHVPLVRPPDLRGRPEPAVARRLPDVPQHQHRAERPQGGRHGRPGPGGDRGRAGRPRGVQLRGHRRPPLREGHGRGGQGAPLRRHRRAPAGRAGRLRPAVRGGRPPVPGHAVHARASTGATTRPGRPPTATSGATRTRRARWPSTVRCACGTCPASPTWPSRSAPRSPRRRSPASSARARPPTCSPARSPTPRGRRSPGGPRRPGGRCPRAAAPTGWR